ESFRRAYPSPLFVRSVVPSGRLRNRSCGFGQIHSHDRSAPRRTVQRQLSAVPFDDAVRDGQPEPRAALFGSVEWLADTRQILRPDAGALAFEFHDDAARPGAAPADRELAP